MSTTVQYAPGCHWSANKVGPNETAPWYLHGTAVRMWSMSHSLHRSAAGNERPQGLGFHNPNPNLRAYPPLVHSFLVKSIPVSVLTQGDGTIISSTPCTGLQLGMKYLSRYIPHGVRHVPWYRPMVYTDLDQSVLFFWSAVHWSIIVYQPRSHIKGVS